MPLISLLIYIVIFAIVAYGLYWVCVHFKLPDPVMWVCGALLLIVLLLFLANQLGLSSGVIAPPIRR
jgi:phosphate starvation-inducible membrane PsiE